MALSDYCAIQTDERVVVELFDIANKRLWYKNYNLIDFNFDFNLLYSCAREDAAVFITTRKQTDNYTSTRNKYRLELKFLVEDKSK